MIQFTNPAKFEDELHYLKVAHETGKPWGGGQFYEAVTKKLNRWHPSNEILLTQSCTSALELAALALDIRPGDQVIVPSYTFVSSANAFALRGAEIVFADSCRGTLNIDLDHVETLITDRTRAVVAVHYGGVACDMERLTSLAEAHGFAVVEDAAQAIGASYHGRPLGTIGDLGCISFHGTKNVSSGEGGALLINSRHKGLAERARLAHEKGTDRASFLKGEVDKYTWRSLGSSFIPSEYTCAVLNAQLDNLEVITKRRAAYWQAYSKSLEWVTDLGIEILQHGGEGANFHMFALIMTSESQRERVRQHLLSLGIVTTTHYQPLHLSPFAIDQKYRVEPLVVAEGHSKRLLRLPMWSEEGLELGKVVDRLAESVLGEAELA